MRSRSAAAVLLGVIAAAACGTTTDASDRTPAQTIHLGWHELDGEGNAGFELEVRALAIDESGWSVDAAVSNRTNVTFQVRRPHVRGGTKFGLFVLRTGSAEEWQKRVDAQQLTPELLAVRFVPPLPRVWRPGTAWKGTFSGPGQPPGGSFVRVAFGRFVTTETPPRGLPAQLLAVTRRSVRIAAE